jgi:hypothetical protein
MCFSNRHTQPSFFPSQDTREVVTWAEGLQLGAAARERLVTGKVSEPEDLVALLQLDNSLWYLGILLHLLSRQALLLFGHMGKVFPVSLELFFRLGGSCQIPGNQPAHLQHSNGATSSIGSKLQGSTCGGSWT